MQTIILASKNKGKIKEMNQLLHDYNIKVVTMEEAGFMDDIVEDGNSLEENAFIKANAIFQKTKQIVIADDSGLFVKALQGAPGIYSARYAGDQKNSEDNNELLLKNLVGQVERNAYFAAVICMIDQEGISAYFRGEIHGKIDDKLSGAKGFGYDPLFIPNEYDKSFGELEDEIKNKISHRAEATKKLLNHLRQKMIQ
jgi:XTP/dITP diphosphohydrolase